MTTLTCNEKGSNDACYYCSHANEEHKVLETWKDGKPCTENHHCEASNKIVHCIEREVKT